MATYTQSPGGVRRVTLDVPVRAWWSRARAWHGDDIVMNVETAYLPDHTAFALRILAADVDPGAEPVDEKSGLSLVNNRCAVPYKIQWDESTLGKKIAVGARCLFFFEVAVDAPAVFGRSNLLYVHLHPYLVSG
ncbi:MAG TPA: hypothetical protein VGL81_02360 [Polyangiaceae bacterium]|jgi:hypothetical protein